MPPKAKFTEEEIITAAFDIVRQDGFSALTARALGSKLGSSARPIFTVFRNMEEVQQAVLAAAKKLYREYVAKGMSQVLAFKGVGIQYIIFAIQEPKLFQLLFMSEKKSAPSILEVLPLIEDSYSEIILSVQEGYAVDKKTAEKLYRHIWIYTHGIAVLSATKICCFNETELNEMLKEVFISLLKEMKAGGSHD